MSHIDSYFNDTSKVTVTNDLSIKSEIFAADGNRQGVYVSTLDMNGSDTEHDNDSLTIIYRAPTAQDENGKYTISAHSADENGPYAKALDHMIQNKALQDASSPVPWKQEFSDSGYIFQFDDTNPEMVIAALKDAQILSDNQIQQAQNITSELKEIQSNREIEFEGNNL
ncbi:MAG: hypothetical protein ACRBB3_07015 [Alphaproteobacteria bacterium]